MHSFGEGNTRATAVFAIKYLRTLEFNVNNELFAENSWFFRNSLVRANYNNFKSKVYIDKQYLYSFFGNRANYQRIFVLCLRKYIDKLK